MSKQPVDVPIGTVMHVQAQRTGYDCTVAALSTLLGVQYEIVLSALAQVAPRVVLDGAFISQVVRAAKLLGVTMRRKRPVDWDEDTGLLRVYVRDQGAYHAVVLRQGDVIDDGRIWPADMWRATRRATQPSLLVVVQP